MTIQASISISGVARSNPVGWDECAGIIMPGWPSGKSQSLPGMPHLTVAQIRSSLEAARERRLAHERAVAEAEVARKKAELAAYLTELAGQPELQLQRIKDALLRGSWVGYDQALKFTQELA